MGPRSGAAVLYAGLIALATFVVIAWSRNHEPAHAMTMTFTALGFAQLLHLGNARSRCPVVLPRRVVDNIAALGALVIVAVLRPCACRHLRARCTPCRSALETGPL